MPVSIAVVCEAAADKATGCDLADRVFCSEIDWITEGVLDNYRLWRGLEPHESHLTWADARKRAAAKNIKAHGHFDGVPGALDAYAARRVLRLLKSNGNIPNAVILLRDDNRETERRNGLEQARQAAKIGTPVVIGLAHTKRECWVLAGFDPCDQNEQQALDDLRKELGFDPRMHADKLTAKHGNDSKSAKRVLAALVGANRDREAQCWIATPLGDLESRGLETGLAAYLEEVRGLLLPLFK